MTPTKLYCVTNTANGKLYAGITSRDLSIRWNEHMKAFQGQQRAYPLHRAMRKYGPDKFTVGTLFEYPSEEDAAAAEIHLIACMRLTKLGYNAGPGGDLSPTQGVGHTPEARAKISARAVAQFSTPAAREMLRERAVRQMKDPVVRERIAASLRGRQLSQEHRDNIGRGHLGRKNSTDTRARMSEAAIRRWARQKEETSHAGA